MEKETLFDLLDIEKNTHLDMDICLSDLFIDFDKLQIVSNKIKSVCFTGNRPASLPWRYNENCELCKAFKALLKVFISKLIEMGADHFISGMAMGFDIIAAETVLELKKEGNPVSLECAIPCLEQTKGWSLDYIKRYQEILKQADKVTFTSNYAYFNGCYNIRNQYMVDCADLIVACTLKDSSGTKNTIAYALKKKKHIISFKP